MSIKQNITSLQNLLEQVNSLPEAGGVELPPLVNEGSAADLMFGKESAGIPYDILANNLDTCYRLPTTDKIRSLNLSNCAAISLFSAKIDNN